jgi:hypothetical protein
VEIGVLALNVACTMSPGLIGNRKGIPFRSVDSATRLVGVTVAFCLVRFAFEFLVILVFGVL